MRRRGGHRQRLNHMRYMTDERLDSNKKIDEWSYRLKGRVRGAMAGAMAAGAREHRREAADGGGFRMPRRSRGTGEL